jgi:dipeptidyl aminopeptidase/acylaminoacyl peptidase
MQIEQADQLKQQQSYKALFNLENNKLIRLEEGTKHAVPWLMRGDYVVVSESNADVYHDQFWKPDYTKFSNWLVSLQDGTRRLLPTNCDPTFMRFLNGQYLVYYDRWQNSNYFSYDVLTDKVTNISEGIPAWQLGYTDPYLHTPDKPSQPYGVATFLSDEGWLLVYDAYDIWQLDITGKIKPRNITNGYGRLHHITFSLLDGDRGNMATDGPAFVDKRTILLRAFNRGSKESGYYKKEWDKSANPEQLFMNRYFFEKLSGISGFTNGLHPVKAADVSKWVVMRQSTTEAPNYFLTEDFKTYRQITNFHPHSNYNWIRTELHRFKQKDGTVSQGVLYKPENFDVTKKYPVIISFYGALSDRLYQYPTPDYISAPDISGTPSSPVWMVSHGYLVFIPDIYFTKNKWGPSVLNTIEGAVNYLRTLTYVDGKHIGSSSHSNGGNFGYYVFTHTKKLAAMSIGSASTNLIGAAFNLTSDNGKPALRWTEQGHYGTGLGELWTHKESWIDHTAVLHADNASCPVLMCHHKLEGGLNPGTTIDMYLSLRRLGRPAWWIQYDYGLHTVSGDDARDLTIRYTQFFDHYLKGAPAPKWMTRGIPYSLKGIDTGYEWDK